MIREKCRVIENKKVAPGHFVLKMLSPRISKNAGPGQFVQILCSDSMDPLLPRPFSFLTASQKEFSILYQVVGKGTKILSQIKKDDSLWVMGPLGNGFMQDIGVRDKGKGIRLLVGGGVGIPPLYHLAEQLVKHKTSRKNIHVFLGARNKSLLLCEAAFRKLKVNLHLATDNGSKGKKGFITEALEDFLHTLSLTSYPLPLIYTCGPTPMLKAVSMISLKYEVPCEVSVEVPMACGFGACLGCAIKIKDHRSKIKDKKWQKAMVSDYRYAIACCEGPVFKADEIVWE